MRHVDMLTCTCVSDLIYYYIKKVLHVALEMIYINSTLLHYTNIILNLLRFHIGCTQVQQYQTAWSRHVRRRGWRRPLLDTPRHALLKRGTPGIQQTRRPFGSLSVLKELLSTLFLHRIALWPCPCLAKRERRPVCMPRWWVEPATRTSASPFKREIVSVCDSIIFTYVYSNNAVV